MINIDIAKINAFVPTPGASGGAEAGFLLIFGPIYGVGNTAVAMILWRIIAFTLLFFSEASIYPSIPLESGRLR